MCSNTSERSDTLQEGNRLYTHAYCAIAISYFGVGQPATQAGNQTSCATLRADRHDSLLTGLGTAEHSMNTTSMQCTSRTGAWDRHQTTNSNQQSAAHLAGVELEDVQHSGHAHLEEHCCGAAAKLHDVTQLCTVQVLLWHWSEEVHPPAPRPHSAISIRSDKRGTVTTSHVTCAHNV